MGVHPSGHQPHKLYYEQNFPSEQHCCFVDSQMYRVDMIPDLLSFECPQTGRFKIVVNPSPFTGTDLYNYPDALCNLNTKIPSPIGLCVPARVGFRGGSIQPLKGVLEPR